MGSFIKLPNIEEGVHLSFPSAAIKSAPDLSKALPTPRDLHLNEQLDDDNNYSASLSSVNGASRPFHVQPPRGERIDWYHGSLSKINETLGTEPRLGKRSRLSMTPSEFNIGTGPLQFSPNQAEELARLSRHDCSTKIPVDSELRGSGNTIEEPPDGGFMAWAHAVAGHLVAFNAQ